MKIIWRFIFIFFTNAIGIIISSFVVNGFNVSMDPQSILKVTILLTILNIFVKPIVKMILSPIIILTLGLGIIVVNAIILYFVDLFSNYVSISGLYPLVYATLIISFLNLIIHFSAKKIYSRSK